MCPPCTRGSSHTPWPYRTHGSFIDTQERVFICKLLDGGDKVVHSNISSVYAHCLNDDHIGHNVRPR
jgi:hypothetical protein